jgi:hypothetical protein
VADRTTAQRLAFPLIVALILVASALRVAGMYDDFWLDEIWSWRIAGDIATPWQILTHPVARFDNNHPLNTLLMWAQGVHPGWRLYRVPALACGTASVVAAVVILRRRGIVEAVVGALLVGFSYPLAFFSSEARGYALVVFFALVAFDALERYVRSRGWVWNLIYVAACALGFLSHLTFAYFFAAAVVWSAVRFLVQRRAGDDAREGEAETQRSRVLDYASPSRARGAAVWHLLRLHLLPATCLALLYVIFVRHLTIGGAPSQSLFEAVRNALGDLLGAQEMPTVAVVLIVVALLLVVLIVRRLRARRDDLWVFLLTVVVMPFVAIALQIQFVEARQPIMARYFLVPFVFFLMGLTILLADWLRRRGARRMLAGTVVVGFVALNVYQTVLFLRVGRGHYQDAVTYMATYPPGRTPPGVIVVSSDHPLRTGLVLYFYSRMLPPQQQIVIYNDMDVAHLAPRTHGPPMWLVFHSPVRGAPPRGLAIDQYVFDREFPYYGLSGYSWYLYRHRGL